MLVHSELFKREILQVFRESHGLILPISNNKKSEELTRYKELCRVIQEAETRTTNNQESIKKSTDEMVIDFLSKQVIKQGSEDIPF